MIFGKGEAGKSTLITTIIPDAININHRGRTIALDFGTYRHDGRVFHFYGTPGQARFDCIRDILAINADHALMVFDASRPIDREDLGILNEIKSLSLPFTAIINLKRGIVWFSQSRKHSVSAGRYPGTRTSFQEM